MYDIVQRLVNYKHGGIWNRYIKYVKLLYITYILYIEWTPIYASCSREEIERIRHIILFITVIIAPSAFKNTSELK